MFGTPALAQTIAQLPSIPGAPEPTSPAAIVSYVFVFAFGVTGLAVFIAFLIGALRYFFAAGSPAAANDGKDRMIHAVVGFFVLSFSILLYYTINPDFLKLRNPGLPTIVLSRGTQRTTGQCGFVSLQWAGGGSPGSQVGLAVVTENCQDGERVTFRVLNALGGMVTCMTAAISGNKASVFWTVPRNVLETTYYFEAMVLDQRDTSGPLNVGSGGGGGGLPTDACANTVTGPPAPTNCTAPCHSTVTAATYGYTCESAIKTAAQEFGVGAELIVSVMQHECSSGDPNCQCSNNADGSLDCGLMQVNTKITSNTGCNWVLGGASQNAAAACTAMKANPAMAIRVGACLLKQASDSAANTQNNYGYPGSVVQYIGGAYAGGSGANEPSCNCYPAGSPPRGCAPEGQQNRNGNYTRACSNCTTNVPKWLCSFDSPDGTQCTRNAGMATAKDMAAYLVKAVQFNSNCPDWQ